MCHTSPTMVLLGALLLTFQYVQSTFVTYPLIPHHVQRERRRKLNGGRDLVEEVEDDQERRRAVDAQSMGALYQGYGTHYIDVWVGTPPQRQTVIVDTGSSITAFPCKECDDCGFPGYHTDNYFMQDQSSTFQWQSCDKCSQNGQCSNQAEHNGQCHIGMSYQEGSSWHAYESVDMAYVGGPHNAPVLGDQDGEDIDPQHAAHLAFPMTFGCQTSLTGLFKTQMADGIMGMDLDSTAFWKQLYNAGKMDKEVFAMCFSKQPTQDRKGTEAGALTLGGIDERLHSSPVAWSALESKAGFFKVQVRAVYLRDAAGGESAVSSNPSVKAVKIDAAEDVLNKNGVIVDSGTTDTYWNNAISAAFTSVWVEMVGKLYSTSPQHLTEEQYAKLPTVLVQLKGDISMNGSLDTRVAAVAGPLDPENPMDVIIAFPPSHYMEYNAAQKTYTNRFYLSEGRNSVLGANFMMGHNIIFDAENSRIGWAESDCDYTKLVTSSGYPSVLDESVVVTPITPGEPVRPNPNNPVDTPIPVEPNGGNGSTDPGANPLDNIDSNNQGPSPIDQTNNNNNVDNNDADIDDVDLTMDDYIEKQSHGTVATDDDEWEDVPTGDDDDNTDQNVEPVGDSGVAPVTEVEKEKETFEESKLDQESEIAQEEEEDGFDAKKDEPTGTGANIHDFQIPTEDIKKSLHHAASECNDVYCIGSMIAIVLATLCCGCLMGQIFCCCCCRRRSSKPKYRQVQVEMGRNGKNGFSSYKDEPEDDDYDPEYGDDEDVI